MSTQPTSSDIYSSREAAKLCFDDISRLVEETRYSFEIWRALFYIENAEEWLTYKKYDPFFRETERAHTNAIIINLFILGEKEDKKGHSVFYLFRKLVGGALINPNWAKEWQFVLDRITNYRDKVALVRNKYLAHRDKNYSWQKAMQEIGLTPEDLNMMTSLCFNLIAARLLCEIDFFTETQVKKSIRKSIRHLTDALLTDKADFNPDEEPL